MAKWADRSSSALPGLKDISSRLGHQTAVLQALLQGRISCVMAQATLANLHAMLCSYTHHAPKFRSLGEMQPSKEKAWLGRAAHVVSNAAACGTCLMQTQNQPAGGQTHIPHTCKCTLYICHINMLVGSNRNMHAVIDNIRL